MPGLARTRPVHVTMLRPGPGITYDTNMCLRSIALKLAFGYAQFDCFQSGNRAYIESMLCGSLDDFFRSFTTFFRIRHINMFFF